MALGKPVCSRFVNLSLVTAGGHNFPTASEVPMVITISEVARGEAGLRLGEAGGSLLECEQRPRPAQHQYSSLILLHGMGGIQ